MAFVLMIAPRPFPAHISSLPPKWRKTALGFGRALHFLFQMGGYGGSAPMFKTGP